jgi:hypothetical protein
MPYIGSRYRLRLNERDLGISQYRQMLAIGEQDRLILIERHGFYVVRPILSGLSVISVERHPGMDRKIENIVVTVN